MSHGWITRLVAGPLERNDAIVRPTSAGSGARPSDATRSERHRWMRTTLTPRVVLSDSRRCDPPRSPPRAVNVARNRAPGEAARAPAGRRRLRAATVSATVPPDGRSRGAYTS